jgi:hypothetical protein
MILVPIYIQPRHKIDLWRLKATVSKAIMIAVTVRIVCMCVFLTRIYPI